MTESAGKKASTRLKAAGYHLSVVGLSLVLSVLVAPKIVPFDPEGVAVAGALCLGFIGHAIAAVAALLIPRVTVRSCAFVFCIAFSFTGCVGLEAFRNWRHLRYDAVYDRFRESVAAPVPKSVTNLHFVPLEESVGNSLTFRFDIDPGDMDVILQNLKLERLEPSNLLNPKDFFRRDYYLPIEGGSHFFQGKDKFGEVLTIKTNESHSHAIFRKESSGIYRDQEWESPNPTIRRMNDEALERLKRKAVK